MKIQRRRKSVARPVGFTLVELLVVIGLIAILISILLPVLGRVRERANADKCLANLRSLGQALTMYTTQTKYYPGTYAENFYPIWPTRLRPFLGGNQGAFYCPSRDADYDWPPGLARSVMPGVMGSPILGDPGFGYMPEECQIGGRGIYAPFSYGYNAMGTSVNSGYLFPARGLGWGMRCPLTQPTMIAAESPGRELRAARVRVPSDMIAISDSALWGSRDIGVDCFGIIPVSRARYTAITIPSAVHSGGTNVLFCDGHVQWYPTQDLIINDAASVMADHAPTSIRDQQVARMWNNDHEP